MAPLARLVVLVAVAVCAHAQYAEERAPRYIASDTQATTPVSILKQINRHNEDGSYTYGYEAGDGSFKIETKSSTGDVKGKYGYKDNTGKLRVIEYGANKYGFQPAGEGITVAPPTLVDESTREPKSQGGRSQYNSPDYDYEEPAPAPPPRARPAPPPRAPPQPQYRPQPSPQPQQQYRPQPSPQPQQQYRPQPSPQPQQQYRPPQQQPQQQYRSQPQPQRPQPQHSAPAPPKPQFFSGAAPSPVEDNFFNPEPAPRQYKPKQEFRPAPQIQEFGSDDFAPSPPRYQPSQVPQQRNTQTYSMLDQLLKEYSLPQGGSAPLHDISFGSY